MNFVKVSIIVPVYNVEEYLVKCLDSLINQTLKEIEIICINDGSTDNSLEILQAYAQKDSRIIVIDKENEGQGIARNLGISKARGEYIGFVDPDDWVSSEMYEKMYTQAKELNSEIVVCDFIKYQDWNGKSWKPNFFCRPLTSADAEHISIPFGVNIDKSLFNLTILISPCYSVNRIFKTELLRKNDIKFDTIRCYEDCIFILRSHLEANNISYINIPFYNYRLRQTSTLRRYEERYKDLLYTYDKIIEYFENNGLYNEFKKNIDYFIFMNAYWLNENLKTQKYKKILKKEVKRYLSNKDYKLFLQKCKSNEKLTIQKIFSITNQCEYKIINLFGYHIKLPRYRFREPIDLVYCWVDGNDVEWQKEKIYWQEKLGIPVTDAINPCRFVDNEELKYSLRSVARNLPWINHIYIVTNGQVPKWLNTNHPKITIINHKDIMPIDALPTFNSEAIEACIANIKGLSEYILYANDDMFVYKHTSPDYFFDRSGKPILRFRQQSKDRKRILNELYLQNVIYSGHLIKEKFGKCCNFESTHNIDAYKKEYFLECRNIFTKEFDTVTHCRFRTSNSLQRTIVNFYMFIKKSCKLRVMRMNSKRQALENIYIGLTNPIFMDRKIQKHRKNLRLFCINDNERTKQEDRVLLKSYLELLFPNCQDWEIVTNSEIKS